MVRLLLHLSMPLVQLPLPPPTLLLLLLRHATARVSWAQAVAVGWHRRPRSAVGQEALSAPQEALPASPGDSMAAQAPWSVATAAMF